jgi:hypothetical protein
MNDTLCSDPPRHRRAAWVLHAGHRLASSDERTPTQRPLWGSALTRVFAGKVTTASGLQRSPSRGRDEGDGARGETRDYLWRMLRFGSYHHAFVIPDHGLRGGHRIEGGEYPAGHGLPLAALDHTRPRGPHGVQLLPHDGVLTSELQCQGAQRAPLQLSAALEALTVPTRGMCTRLLEALPQGTVCPPARLPEVLDVLPVHGEHGQDQHLLRGKEIREAALVDAGRPAELVHPHRRIAAGVHEGAGAKCNLGAQSKNRMAGMP